MHVATNWPYLGRELSAWGMDSPLSCIGAIGTAAVEASFYPREEADYLNDRAAMNRWYADTSKHAVYQGGIKYHGFGLVQTTHLSNFVAVQKMLKDRYGLDVNLVDHPELLMKIEYAAPAFCQYWDSRGLDVVSERQDWLGVRRGVFGGTDNAGAARIKRAADALIPLVKQRGFL